MPVPPLESPPDLAPAMDTDGVPSWVGARWIGAVDAHSPATGADLIPLAAATGFATARLLVRDGLAVRGFVEVPIEDCGIRSAVLSERIALLPPAVDLPVVATPPTTVAVTTRNRPHRIRALLPTLLALDYPDYEIVIVDNAPDDDATQRVVRDLGSPRIRYVREPLPGASRGRNAAILSARHDFVAFVDDDVVVDPGWLHGIALGFSRSADVGIVTGMVPTGELVTPAQGYFEARINWETTQRSRVFSLQRPPADIPLFPFEVGVYGTGANFAVRRDYVLQIGGLNEALGTGSPAGGGEDIDLFVRLLYAGHDLVYEPTALVWHRHRAELEALSVQISAYGRGFGAWLAVVLADRRMRRDALRLVLQALRRLRAVGESEELAPSRETDLDIGTLRRLEVMGMLSGPFWYVRSRLDRRLPRPLASR